MNVFELFASLSLDASGYENGLDNAESKGKSFASSIGSVVGGAVTAVGTATVAAVGAAATGITTLTTQAVQAYGSYEQLVGGVNKIFGDSADQVIANAAQAYTTAGMSANEYMETVTSFSASLIQSLEGDTVKAAEYADMAIADMSDNANTFGTDISSIQNAYQGFAKGNYTMLDNLKLGYGGTKSEMERLIEDAAALSDEFEVQYDEAGNLVYGYGDIVEAIHIVQEEMNITGTTAAEASETIQGTAGSLQAAWDNLIIGLGDANADLAPLIDNVVQSALQMVDNIKPIALQAVQGISELIKGFAPVLEEELPPLIEEILPALTDAIVSLINTVAAVLPSLIEVLLPPILTALVNVAVSLLNALPTILNLISSQLPLLLQVLIPAILQVLPSIIEAGLQIIMALASGLASNIGLIMDAVMGVIHVLVDTFLTVDNIKQFVILADQVILTIAEALLANAPELLGAFVILISNIIVALAEALPDLAADFIGAIVLLGEDIGNLIYEAFGTTLLDMYNSFITWVTDMGTKLAEFGTSVLTGIGEFGADCIEGVANFMADIIEWFVSGFDSIKQTVTDALNNVGQTFSDIFENAKNIVSGAIEFIKGLFDFEWKLPELKLPHFTISGDFNLDPTNFSMPTIGVEWYAKAMNTPYLLDNATIFGAAGGKLLGGGESGNEMVYGHDQLMADIAAVVDAKLQSIQLEITAPIYIGGKKIDQQVIMANARNSVISGGR